MECSRAGLDLDDGCGQFLEQGGVEGAREVAVDEVELGELRHLVEGVDEGTRDGPRLLEGELEEGGRERIDQGEDGLGGRVETGEMETAQLRRKRRKGLGGGVEETCGEDEKDEDEEEYEAEAEILLYE